MLKITPHGTDGATPTVKVVSDEPGHKHMGGYVEINASQFDPTRHKLMPGETNPIDGSVDGKAPTPKKSKSGIEAANKAGSAVQLLGSEKEPFNKPLIIIQSKPVEVVSLIASAHAKSGMTAEAWNKLDDGDRFVLLENEVKARAAWG